MRDAAAVPLIFITAWEGLVDRAGVHSGQKVLVHGGAGGVGHHRRPDRPLATVAEAYRAVESNDTAGKIVVELRG
jgi:NADPH:quinone reductase-like Zn-dependent oxidoreductase